jgi:glycine/D-amino acid oxidase-like deaminating enzyme
VIIGGGVHGLSTAYHLARRLREKGAAARQGAWRIVLLEKKRVGAGASGIACGVVRNFYYQPAMNEIVRLSVEVWEEHGDALGYQPVGYVAAVPAPQVEDVVAIAGQQRGIGYRSEVITGADDCRRHMEAIFPDYRAQGIEGVLHEYQGGYADRTTTIEGLARLAASEGVDIREGVTVTGFDVRGGQVHAVQTTAGDIACDVVVVAPGPWAGRFWSMLDLPMEIDMHTPDGRVLRKPMFTYWKLQEGEVHLDQPYVDAAGGTPPVVHLDHVVPLVSDMTGEVITEKPWGIYWKKDAGGVQGGSVPINLGTSVELEPYGHDNPEHIVDASFADYFTAGLAYTLGRFKWHAQAYRQQPNGGIGAFTPDNFPVFDFVLPNVYMIADSNHGFKLLGVGREVAALLTGEARDALKPFALSRYETGALHPPSHGPFPWT